MYNRYQEAVNETVAHIQELRERIQRFEARGLSSRVPAIEAEIVRLENTLPTLRGTASLVKQMYGNYL